MTTRAASNVDLLVHLMDSAFAGQFWHSLLRNLSSCTPDDWDWVPPGGKRTIRDIVRHVAGCKLRWQDQIFGERQFDWDDIETITTPRTSGAPDEVIAWLRQVHADLHSSVADLADDDLPLERPGYWAEPRHLRFTIEIMIQHDLYHAGEINHIRALHQGNDA